MVADKNKLNSGGDALSADTIKLTEVNRNESTTTLLTPSETRHFWYPKQYDLTTYESYAALAIRHICCCCKLYFCLCQNYIEPGTIDHCVCFCPSTCYYCSINERKWCFDYCCIPVEWCANLPCNILIGPCSAIYHNIEHWYSREHRYDRHMRYDEDNYCHIDLTKPSNICICGYDKDN